VHGGLGIVGHRRACRGAHQLHLGRGSRLGPPRQAGRPCRRTAFDEAQERPKRPGGSALTFGYGPYGNLTTDYVAGVSPAIGYGYDAGDRLTSITPSSGPAATFGYDALGRIRTKVIATTPSGTTEARRYAGASETVVGIATSGDTTSTLDAITDPAGTRLGAKVGSGVRWFTPDLHGSNAALLADNEASIVEASRHDALTDGRQVHDQVIVLGGSHAEERLIRADKVRC